MSMKRSTTRITRRAAWCAALPGVLGAFAGCNILGPVPYLLTGPEKTPALHELDPVRPTLIFIDDRRSQVPTRAARMLIGTSATGVLLEKGALQTVIEPDAAIAAVQGEKFGEPRTIADVGRAAGADVVVYATVDQFTLSRDGQTFTPMVAMRVKVVDAATEQRIWPDGEQEWHRLNVVPPPSGAPVNTIGERRRAEQTLAERAGRDLAYVFVEHITERVDIGPERPE